MKTSSQINFVIAILGLGIALGSLASVIDFPAFWIFSVGLTMVLIGILRAIEQIEEKPIEKNIQNKSKTKEKLGFAIR